MQKHATSFIAHTEASTGCAPPRFIKDAFHAFLESGIEAHGFLRLRCGECGHDKPLAAQRAITRHLLDGVGLQADEAYGGTVTLIQHFGSAVNLNVHLHCLVLDGTYRCGADDVPSFVEVNAPSDDELHALLQTMIARMMKLLTRQGVLVEDMGQTYLAEPDADGDEVRTLWAAVRVEAHDRKSLEQLCRHITRSALSEDG